MSVTNLTMKQAESQQLKKALKDKGAISRESQAEKCTNYIWHQLYQAHSDLNCRNSIYYYRPLYFNFQLIFSNPEILISADTRLTVHVKGLQILPNICTWTASDSSVGRTFN